MSDDASLSEHEQRILAEIERNLLAEDPDLARRVRDGGPDKGSIRFLRLGLVATILGFALMLAYATYFWLGVFGFLLMLAGGVTAGLSLRQMTSAGRPPAAVFKDALRRAESRIRDRKPKP